MSTPTIWQPLSGSATQWLATRYGIFMVSAFAGITMLVSSAWPLATYTLALALFGIAHVTSELRYVDYRFSHRLGRNLRQWLFFFLGTIVIIRILNGSQFIPSLLAVVIELLCVVLLILPILPLMQKRRWMGIGTAVLLAVCTLISPFYTLLFFSVAHNLTPLGFLAESLGGNTRRKILTIGGIVFILVPILIASGIPFSYLNQWGLTAPEASILSAGPLSAHLGIYVPKAFHHEPWALYAFSAAVFSQCMHYASVIYVLPRLLPTDLSQLPAYPVSIVKWDSLPNWILIGLGALFLAGFILDFFGTRWFYGLFASVHAWIEIPLLLLALGTSQVSTGQENPR